MALPLDLLLISNPATVIARYGNELNTRGQYRFRYPLSTETSVNKYYRGRITNEYFSSVIIDHEVEQGAAGE